MKTPLIMRGISLVGLSFLGAVTVLAVYNAVDGVSNNGNYATQRHFVASGEEEISTSCIDPELLDNDSLVFETQGTNMPPPREQGPFVDEYTNNMSQLCVPGQPGCRRGSCYEYGYADTDRDGFCGKPIQSVSLQLGPIVGDYVCGYYRPNGNGGAKVSLILNGDCNDFDPSYSSNRAPTNLPCDYNGDTIEGDGRRSCRHGAWTCIEGETRSQANRNRLNQCTPYFPELDFNDSGTVSTEDIWELQAYVRDNNLTSNTDPVQTHICNEYFGKTTGSPKNCDVGGDAFLNRHDPNLLRSALSNPQGYLNGGHCLYGLDTDCDGVADVNCNEFISPDNVDDSISNANKTTIPSNNTIQVGPNVPSYDTSRTTIPSNNTIQAGPTLYNPSTYYNYQATSNDYVYDAKTNTYIPSVYTPNNVWLNYMQTTTTKNARGY